MMGSAALELVLHAVFYITSSTYIVFYAYIWWRDRLHRHWLTKLCSLAPFFRRGDVAASDDVSFEEEVDKFCARRRLQRFRDIVKLIAPVCVFGQLYSMESINPDRLDKICEMATRVSIVLGSLAVQLCPGVFTCASADAFMTFIAATGVIGRVVLHSDSLDLLFNMSSIASIRFCLGVLANFELTGTLINIVCGIVSILTFSSMPFNNQASPPSLGTVVVREVMATAAILVMSKVTRSCMVAEARATLTYKASKHSEVMANTLLTALCDAVVHLDESLLISKAAPQLAALLLLQQRNKDLKGNRFLDLVENADRKQFEDLNGKVAMSLPTNRGDANLQEIHPARLMHLHLLDANGTRVSVQLLLATCLHFDDSVNHVVGIREIGCDEGLPYRMGDLARNAAICEPIAFPGTGDFSGSQSDYASSSESEWSEQIPFGTDLDHVRVTMTIDTENSREYGIIDCVPAIPFRDAPALVGTSLVDWVRGSARKRLVDTIQSLVNDIINNSDADGKESEPVRRSDIGTLEFRPPGNHQANSKYQASCIVEAVVVVDDTIDGDDGSFLVKVILTNLASLTRKRSRNQLCCGSPRPWPNGEATASSQPVGMNALAPEMYGSQERHLVRL